MPDPCMREHGVRHEASRTATRQQRKRLRIPVNHSQAKYPIHPVPSPVEDHDHVIPVTQNQISPAQAVFQGLPEQLAHPCHLQAIVAPQGRKPFRYAVRHLNIGALAKMISMIKCYILLCTKCKELLMVTAKPMPNPWWCTQLLKLCGIILYNMQGVGTNGPLVLED